MSRNTGKLIYLSAKVVPEQDFLNWVLIFE